MQEIKEQLEKIYEESNLRKDGCPLVQACDNSCNWESRKKTPPMRSYVGEEYEKHRILFVGINYNGSDVEREKIEQNELFDYVRKYISKDPGSICSQHIDGVIHALTTKIVNGPNLNPSDTGKMFAFTNIVKCSVDKDAGKPTNTMYENCAIRRGYVFKEIEILKPKLIICIGDPPFEGIRSHFADSVLNKDEFGNWLFRFENNGDKTYVLRVYNPPSGYRYIRSEWNKVQKGNLSETWRKFFRECNSEKDMVSKVMRRELPLYPNVFQNKLYEYVIDFLINKAHN